ncbi:hypothetical protein ACN4EK_09265 [Pantanalinema rosaneae CENA516]|uniref:hypothetical protein n=1 Tax=Pantanalinema rosaneae TaxID=1620701 RepID=UPI003D6FF11E
MKTLSLAIAATIALMAAAVSTLNPDPAAAMPLEDTRISWVATKHPVLRVTLSSDLTETGERLLNLDLVVNGQVKQRLQAVSGKADVQHFRLGQASRANSREPLPQGMYTIGQVDRAGGLPQAMGDTFIPLAPQFATGRSGLGIHLDADRPIGPGTIGCLALLTQADIDTVARFVSGYNVRTLIVDYGL